MFCVNIYYWLRYRLDKENRPKVIMPTHPKLTQVPRVTHDILIVVGRPLKIICRKFCVNIYYWLIYRLNKENRPIVIMPTHPKLIQVSRVIHDILDVMGRPQGSYAERFVTISLLLADI